VRCYARSLTIPHVIRRWPSSESRAAPYNVWMVDRFLKPILALLRQGVTPEKVALSIALGVICGLFPIVGATTVLCVVAALVLRLNQVGIQIVNYAVFPFQVGGIPFFVRFGEWLVGAPHAPLSPVALARQFQEDPSAFMRAFGLTGLHGILGWTIVAPFLSALLYATTVPVLRRAAEQLQGSKS